MTKAPATIEAIKAEQQVPAAKVERTTGLSFDMITICPTDLCLCMDDCRMLELAIWPSSIIPTYLILGYASHVNHAPALAGQKEHSL